MREDATIGSGCRVAVGVISRRYAEDPCRPFGTPTVYFEECARAGLELGIDVFFFEPSDVDIDAGTIASSRHDESGWSGFQMMGLPDVVYDRAPLYDSDFSPAADRLRHRLVQAEIPFVNPVEILQFAGDKMAVHDHLRTAGFSVPVTHRADADALESLLNQWKHVYLKPVHGSNGDGIFEVRLDDAGVFYMRNDTEDYTAPTFSELAETVRRVIGNFAFGADVYLVQQGISIDRHGEQTTSKFDLRVIVQKDENRIWKRTGIAARVSLDNSHTTNLSRGARAEVPEPILEAEFGIDAAGALLDSIDAMCLAICKNLDLEICEFGELGIDVMVNADAEPLVIEINAKPGRACFKRIAFSEDVNDEVRTRFRLIRDRSVMLPFAYASSLASPVGAL